MTNEDPRDTTDNRRPALDQLTHLTGNIYSGTRHISLHGCKVTREAMFWVTQRESRQRVELLAPFIITNVARRHHVDVDGTTVDLSDVTTWCETGTKTITVHPVDTVSLGHLRKAFSPSGRIEDVPNGDPLQGSAATQMVALLHSPLWAGQSRTTVETLGRVRHQGHDVFTLPGLTLSPAGPLTEPIYQPFRANTARDRIVVAPYDRADLERLVTTFLDAAIAADPDDDLIHAATVLGWGAATCYASRTIARGLAGGHPMLWNTGTPGSGKTEMASRLLTPFGVDPHNVAGSFSTVAQLRDALTATVDVPQLRDEVKVAYLHSSVAAELPRLLKVAYNAQGIEVGGRWASGPFAQRAVPSCPTLAFNSEGSPPGDQAVLDRLIVLPWQRLASLPGEVRSRAAAGFAKLQQATADGAMAPAAGAWFTYAAGTDLSQPLGRAQTTLTSLGPGIASRPRTNLEIVLAGLYAYKDFCTIHAPTALDRIDTLIDAYTANGVSRLCAELRTRSTHTGAAGILRLLAALSDQPSGPLNGSHYRLSATTLAVNTTKALLCLRRHAASLSQPVPDDHEFTNEIRSWPGVTRGKHRDRHESGNPVAYWHIPWATLSEVGGPAPEDFKG